MEFTEPHQVPCLSEDDYAAVALYMKCLGLKIDQDVYDRQITAQAFLHRPISVWEMSGTVFSPGTNTLSGSLFYRYNWPLIATSRRIPNLRGWWHVGVNAKLQAQGVANADTRRILRLRVDHVAFSTSRYAEFTDKEFESNTGNGENLLAQGTFFFPGITGPPTIEGAVLSTAAESGNTGSDVDVVPALSHMWAYYMGDTPQIAAVP